MGIEKLVGDFNQLSDYPLRSGQDDGSASAVERKWASAASTDSGASIADSPAPAYATPISAGTVTDYGLSGENRIDSLLYGVKWGSGGPGSGADLTYSFGTSESRYSNNYAYQEPFTGFAELSPAQQAAVDDTLGAWAELTNLRLTEVTDSAAVAGDLRFAKSSAPETAWSYMPGLFTESGDVWIGYNAAYEDMTPGSYGYFAVMHEIGHALGLTHPHDQSGISTVADSSIDTTAQSIMSYRSYENAPLDAYPQNFFPTTPMPNDVAAIQYLYGVNQDTRSGDDVYRWDQGEQLLETLWDAGGNDTIDWSNQTSAAVINLGSGAWSELGPAYWTGVAYETKTLAIAEGVTIENAAGGTAGDRLVGNADANLLSGGGGNDALYGAAGDDQLEGGAGNDQLFGADGEDIALFTGAQLDYDIFVEDGAAITVQDNNVADGDDGVDSLLDIEHLQFRDGIFALEDNTAPQAVDDHYVGSQGETLVATASDSLLLNDSDPDGDMLIAELLRDTANGSLDLNGDGSFAYVPDANFNGADSFSYSVSDDHGGSDSATVAITIEPAASTPNGKIASGGGTVTEEDGSTGQTIIGQGPLLKGAAAGVAGPAGDSEPMPTTAASVLNDGPDGASMVDTASATRADAAMSASPDANPWSPGAYYSPAISADIFYDDPGSMALA